MWKTCFNQIPPSLYLIRASLLYIAALDTEEDAGKLRWIPLVMQNIDVELTWTRNFPAVRIWTRFSDIPIGRKEFRSVV